MSMRSLLSLQICICMTMFSKKYIGLYRAIFSKSLLRYCWENTLVEWCIHFESEGYRRMKFKIRVCCYGQYDINLFKHMPFINRYISLGCLETPRYYFIFRKPMIWEYKYMPDFGRSDVVTSSYWHLNYIKKRACCYWQ